MKYRMFIQVLGFAIATFMLSGCLIGKLSAPDLPQKFNKPSPVTMTEINGLTLGLPKGWKSVEVPEDLLSVGGFIQLEHKKYAAITIYKAPDMADARYGKIYTQTLVGEIMPDYEPVSGAYGLESGAIIETYEGTLKVSGYRMKFVFYGGYNISQGMTEYFMHGLESNGNGFYDFIAIANSI
jgi:hypothetical protein